MFKKSRILFTLFFLTITAALFISSASVFASSILYKVKSGDTLYIIATKYGTSTTDIIQSNNLSSTTLYIGQPLNINVNPNYTVKSGDTLYLVGAKFNASIDDLVNYNNLMSTSINVGQILRIAPPDSKVDLKSGAYVGAQIVSPLPQLSSLSSFYSLDGKAPTSNSTQFTTPINIDKNSVLKIVASKNGNYSDIVQYNYTVNYPPQPVAFNMASGSYLGGQSLSIMSDKDIFYTIDESVPDNRSSKYVSPIQILKDTTVKAVSFDSVTGLYSLVREVGININKPSTPASDILPGNYEDILNISLKSQDGGSILFTTDGSDPIVSGTTYTSPIILDKTTLLRTVSSLNGVVSNESDFNYSINLIPHAPVPNIDPGQYSEMQNILLSTSSANSEIYYTLDGTTPSSSSNKFSGPITLSEPTTIKAVAINKYGYASEVSTLEYQVLIKPDNPTIETASGTYYTPVSLSIVSQPNTAIYYTLDGTEPNTSSYLYSGQLTLTNSAQLRVIAVSKYGVISNIVANNYTINLTPESPAFNLQSGVYYGVQNITLTTAAPYASIFYTLDGTTPTASSLQYASPVSISKNITIKAVSIRNGYISSVSSITLKVYLQQFINYTVASGDTLDTIAKKYYSTPSEIISLNGLTTNTLNVGQVLKIYSYKYIVQSGDNLAIIAERSNTTVDNIIAANSMASDIIFVGQPIKLAAWGTNGISTNKGFTIAKTPSCPASKLPPPSVTSRPEYNVTFASQKEEDLYWLSRIIYSEARGEIYTGQVAVGNVVINRSKYEYLKIKDVVFESSGGYIQFEPVINGSIFNTPNTSSQNAALDTYNGQRPVGNCLYFLNPATAQSSWIAKNRTYYMTIGNHDFYQ